MASLLLMISLITLIFIKHPISVAMGVATLVGAYAAGYPVHLLPQGIIDGSMSWSLLSVPFFIIAGNLMNEFGVAEKIFDLAAAVVGHVRAGMAHVNVIASMIFAGISGSAAADCAGLGPIEIKAMTDQGYDLKYSTGVTIASAILGPIIPPSIAFILYGVMANVSIARLFLGGILPGIVIGVCLMAFNVILARKYPDKFPRGRRRSMKEILESARTGFPAVMAPVIILIGMTSGVVSPTEAGIAAIVYSYFLGILYRKASFKGFIKVAEQSMLTAAHALVLVGVAHTMTKIMTLERTPNMIADLILGLTSSKNVVLFMIILLLLFLGCFMSATSALVLITPILVPLVQRLGVDLTQFGVMLAYGLHIGIATPPVGIGLFILADITKLSLEDVVKGVAPYYIPLIIALLVITYVPAVTTFLPSLLMPQ